MRLMLPIVLAGCLIFGGCGTSRWTDTRRTATEQLLISDAMDRAVSKLDFCSLAGKKVYLDSSPIKDTLDAAYLISTLRQHMLASGCMLKDVREDADYVVEVRAGAVGTDRRELLVGVPATKIPSVLPVPGVPSSVPEIPLAKRTEQRAVTKIAVFAYNRYTGRPVWQSGVLPMESKAKDIWVLGAGPFQRGTIYEGTEFAGGRLAIPLISPDDHGSRQHLVSVADEAFFSEPKIQLAGETPEPASKSPQKEHPADTYEGVIQASHTEPALLPEPESPPQPLGDGNSSRRSKQRPGAAAHLQK